MELNKEKVVLILQLTFFNIILSTWDQYSDIRFAFILFNKGHTYWALAVISPTIVNAVFTFYSWYHLESRSQKWYSWFFLILQLWPQLYALRIVKDIVKNNSKWRRDKALMERSICLLEPFLESIPQTIILTNLLYITMCQNTSCKESYRLIIGDNGVIFCITYASSILGAGFGLVAFLKSGPVKTLPSVFPNWPYILTLISVLGTIIAKGLLLVIITLHSATFFSLIIPPRSLSYITNTKCYDVTVMKPLLFEYGTNSTSRGGYTFIYLNISNNNVDFCKDSTGNDIGVCAFYCGDWTILFQLLSLLAWLMLLILPQGNTEMKSNLI